MSRASHSRTQKITLIILGLVVAGTVFLLPRLVTEPWVAPGLDDAPEVPTAKAPAVTPSTAAELTRYRQDSQGVLAEIVTMRDRLEQRNVQKWAEAEFQLALKQVEQGDERYSYGEYQESLARFQEARDRLVEIEQLGQQKLADARVDAESAIESLNLPAAEKAVHLASLIAPEDPEVQVLAQRVAILPQVARHIEAGDQALAQDRFEAAQTEYREAARIDPLHRRAARSLAGASKAVTDGAFRDQMSRGFAALDRGEYETARVAFQVANQIDPGNPAVSRALAQVNNRQSDQFVRRELERAAQLEAAEQWAEALSVYEALLQQDASLTDARARQIPARVRAELDTRLQGYIDEPLRLSSQAEYRAAQTALTDARGIPDRGPRLQRQITELETITARANSPVDVVLQSDNQTHVVVFRVAELGRFEQISIRLRPGKYVASGTRAGYRDVQVEFTITGEPLEQPIVVRCEEPIG